MKITSKELGIIFFILIFIGIGLYTLFNSPKRNSSLIPSECPLEYGKLECVKDKPHIPFFNPNDFDLKKIQIMIPKANGVDIYQVTEPLKSKKVEVLTLSYHDCSLKKMEKFTLKWCCQEKCYNVSMNNPSEEVKVKLKEE